MAIKSYRGLRFCTDTCILSVLTPTDFHHGWANFGPLADKTLERGISRAPSQRKVFRTLFIHVLRWQFETWHKHLAGGVTHQVRVSLQSGQLTYFTAKNRQTSFICIHGLQNYIGPRFGTQTYMVSVLTLLIFVMVSPAKSFPGFFFRHVLRYELETWYIHPVGCTTHQAWVSSQSGLCLWRVFWGTFFLNVLRYQLESWFIHSLGRTTYWVPISPEWGPCDILHVLSVGAVN